MRNTNPVWKGLLLLVVAGAIGYGIGLVLDLLVSGAINTSGPVGAAFAILFAVTAFFFGVYGYRGITRGLVYQVVGTLIGALLITGIRALMGLDIIFGVYLFSEPAWVVGGLVGVGDRAVRVATRTAHGVAAVSWTVRARTPRRYPEPGTGRRWCIRNGDGALAPVACAR